MNILIAEDFEDTRLILTMALEASGYHVTCTNNGRQALARAREDIPDLIISDILMPEMDGFDLCRAVKKDPILHHIPFVFYTATYIEEQDRDLAMAAGASRFIVKPVDTYKFLAIVREVLAECEQQRLEAPMTPQKSDAELELMHERSLSRMLDEKVWQLERERRALTLSETKYRTLFESSGDAIILLNKEAFINCNRATLTMFGCASQAEFLGTHVATWSPDTQPGGIASQQLADERINQALTDGSNHFEWVLRRMDGSEFAADVQLTAMVLDDTLVLQAIVRDISDHKSREATLRKLSSCIEQSGESIIITDRNGAIEYVNAAFTSLTGYPFEDVRDKTPRVLNSGNHNDAFYQDMWQTITAGRPWHGKVIDRRKDGSLYPAYLHISPIHDGTDQRVPFTHFVAIQSDLSSFEEMEKQFQQAQKMEEIGTLVGGIAHDFNNMLAGITGNLYLARTKAEGNRNLLQNLENIESLSFRAADMIKQLLTFARKGQVSMKPILFAPFIKETLKFLRSAITENIAIDQDMQLCEALRINGDSTQLHQVLMNLVNNARDALELKENPCISIRLTPFHTDDAFLRTRPLFKAGSYAHLSVADNGSGISEHQIKHLFEPFFTTKEQGKGTGLGLAMVYGAIKMHHGLVEVDSEKGKGTTFHIYLPLLQQEQSASESEAMQQVMHGRGELILLADDEQTVRNTTVNVLETFGYRLLKAADGLEAIALFDAHQPDIALAILDVVMPNCGGQQVASHIHASKPDLPIIFVTGYDKQHVLSLDDPGPKIEILSKPVKFEALSHSIRQLLD